MINPFSATFTRNNTRNITSIGKLFYLLLDPLSSTFKSVPIAAFTSIYSISTLSLLFSLGQFISVSTLTTTDPSMQYPSILPTAMIFLSVTFFTQLLSMPFMLKKSQLIFEYRLNHSTQIHTDDPLIFHWISFSLLSLLSGTLSIIIGSLILLLYPSTTTATTPPPPPPNTILVYSIGCVGSTIQGCLNALIYSVIPVSLPSSSTSSSTSTSSWLSNLSTTSTTISMFKSGSMSRMETEKIIIDTLAIGVWRHFIIGYAVIPVLLWSIFTLSFNAIFKQSSYLQSTSLKVLGYSSICIGSIAIFTCVIVLFRMLFSGKRRNRAREALFQKVVTPPHIPSSFSSNDHDHGEDEEADDNNNIPSSSNTPTFTHTPFPFNTSFDSFPTWNLNDSTETVKINETTFNRGSIIYPTLSQILKKLLTRSYSIGNLPSLILLTLCLIDFNYTSWLFPILTSNINLFGQGTSSVSTALIIFAALLSSTFFVFVYSTPIKTHEPHLKCPYLIRISYLSILGLIGMIGTFIGYYIVPYANNIFALISLCIWVSGTFPSLCFTIAFLFSKHILITLEKWKIKNNDIVEQVASSSSTYNDPFISISLAVYLSVEISCLLVLISTAWTISGLLSIFLLYASSHLTYILNPNAQTQFNNELWVILFIIFAKVLALGGVFIVKIHMERREARELRMVEYVVSRDVVRRNHRGNVSRMFS